MKVSANLQTVPCSDCHLQFDDMKLELQVIADHHAAVNMYPGLVHTACQIERVRAPRRNGETLGFAFDDENTYEYKISQKRL